MRVIFQIIGICVIFLFCGMFTECLAVESPVASARPLAATALYEGKIALDAGQYQRAIKQLSEAAANLPLLSDYALYWRAKAHFGAGDAASALSDLQASRESRPGTPLSKAIRLLEIECEKKRSGDNLDNLFRRYIADYPEDLSTKYRYALFLKEQGKTNRARALFHELFLTVSPAAKLAEAELDRADITAEDLLTKARNLNSTWMFQDAEKRFRDAIEMKPSVRASAYNGLAYAMFRQKKYPEAADLYEKTGNTYWHARSLLRSNQLQAFEGEIDALLRLRESRAGSLLLSYASKKRREGDASSALRMYDKVASRYASEREEALWLTGWTHYRAKDFATAAELFGRLQASYGKMKYLYWKNRSLEQAHPATARKYPTGGAGDFYAFVSSVREAQPFAGVVPGDTGSRRLNSERVALLLSLGFLREASGEIQLIAAKTSSSDTLLAASEQFRQARNYKLSIQTAAKIPYRSAIHDLYFPVAYRAEVEEAARKTGLDAGLLLAVIREESLFDPDARSIAGALGLMQLMPQTAQRVAQSAGIPYRSADDIYQPRTNIMLGATYLKSLVAEFGGIPYAIAAYNAGEEVVREWIRTGAYGAVDEFMEDIPYYETRNYTKKVLTSYFQYLRMRDETDIRAVQRQLGLL